MGRARRRHALGDVADPSAHVPGEGLASWTGLLVVLQNMLSSQLNSHLFDFSEGC